VTGLDLVREQIRIAAGEALGYRQEDVRFRGAAIECRVYAEDPAADFLPQAGAVLAVREPAGPGVRIDSGLLADSAVPVEYDPLLAKISTWGETRAQAIARMLQALDETAIIGPTTNLAFLHDIVRHPAFRRGDTHTAFVPEHFPRWTGDAALRDIAAIVAALVQGADASAGSATAGLPSGTGGGPGRGGLPSPWITLGPWRVGGPGGGAPR
jgi:acetyl/propionyl-CoA carboxylase alpha subunit